VNILSLSLDQSVLDPESKTARRLSRFGEFVDRYDAVVPSASRAIIQLSEKVSARGSGGGNKFFRLFRTRAVAESLLRERKYDLITVQDPYYLASMARTLAKRFRIGLEIQVHGFEKLHGFRKLIAKRNLSKADRIRTVSERQKKALISDFGISPVKISVVPVYTDVGSIDCPPKKNSGFVFLTVARLVPVKNISLQLEALSEVVRKHPLVRFVIVGDGPDMKNLVSRAKQLGVFSLVDFVGRTEDTSPWYCSADAFLLTSDSEGWGIVAIEAASHSLPIIMTDVGLAGEIIKNNESGIIVPVGGKIELIEAMESLVASEDLRRRLGDGARAAVQKLPSFEDTMKRYVEGWDLAIKR
jgi:glycosyltransferase involved in cell wall biosynthesis